MTLDELKAAIVADLMVELAEEPMANATILAAKVGAAITEVKRARKYAAAGYSEEMIQADIEQYYSNIRNLALYDYNQIGDEFQRSATEPSVTRLYLDRKQMLCGVTPLAIFSS